jgi:hypothetical protein
MHELKLSMRDVLSFRVKYQFVVGQTKAFSFAHLVVAAEDSSDRAVGIELHCGHTYLFIRHQTFLNIKANQEPHDNSDFVEFIKEKI